MIAPAGDVVHEDVFSPDNDVLHSWWVPQLGGKIDAIPGRDEPHVVPGAGGAVPRPLRRPLRDPAHDDAGVGEGRAARRVREFIKERAANPASIELGKEEWEHVCSVCHKLDEAYVGPALGENPLLTHAKDLETILRQGVGKMPAVGSDWTRRPDPGARQVHDDTREGPDREGAASGG